MNDENRIVYVSYDGVVFSSNTDCSEYEGDSVKDIVGTMDRF